MPGARRQRYCLATAGDKPGVYRGRTLSGTKRHQVQLDIFGNRVSNASPLHCEDRRLCELEQILSHDQWESVAGRDELWREVSRLLAANPRLRTTLMVPDNATEQKDWKMIHHDMLAAAIIEEDDAALESALRGNKRADVNIRAGRFLFAPLHHAADNLPIVELLLSRAADVNVRDADGMTPLHCVTEVACARLLLAAGASANACDKYMRTPLHYEVEDAPSIALTRLLLEADADVNAVDAYPTPVHGHPQTPLQIVLHYHASYWSSAHHARHRTAETGLQLATLLCAHGAVRDPTFTQIGDYMGCVETRTWLLETADWITPLHHFDILAIGYLRKLLRSSIYWTQEVHPWMPRVDLHARAGPSAPSPLELASSQPEAARSASASLVVRASQPWSPQNHELFPLEARTLVAALLPIGYHLEFHRHFRGFGTLWTQHVLSQLITRESQYTLRVTDVLSMRPPLLRRELIFRGLEPSEERAVMVGRLLDAIGALGS